MGEEMREKLNEKWFKNGENGKKMRENEEKNE